MVALYLLIGFVLFLIGRTVVRAARRRDLKNLFRQPFQNPTPTMTAVWFVFLLAFVVEAISVGFITIVLVATYNGMLPTVTDPFHPHPTQVMGHRAYLSDFLDLLYAGAWWGVIGSIIVGYAVRCMHSVLGQRETDRRHNILIEWMKSRPE
jgi:amino acid transporter